MCGVAGVLYVDRGLGPSAEDESVVEGMLSALRHRGPDQRARVTLPRAVLGNTRLRIQDLTPAGDLPLRSDDGGVTLAYNGEVTNFRALRARHRLDERFAMRSGSDAEVALRLYELLGPSFLDELTGMFALCLVDDRAGRAWLARDPFGQRPMYTLTARGRLWFSSEIAPLRAAPGFTLELDREGFHHFLALGYFPGERTPYSAVRELRPGRLVEVDLRAGEAAERRWFSPRYEPVEGRGEERHAAELLHAMRDSVARNLVSDAPLGVTLSGGVDTTSILALAREALGPRADVHTFSVVIDEPSFDESRWQRAAVERFRPVHHSLRFGPRDVEALLDEHMAALQEPSADGAAIPFYALARLAAPHVRALLSGEGGDEVFNAYETHGAHRARALYRALSPAPLRALAATVAEALPTSHRKLSFDFLAKRFTRGAELPPWEAHLYWRHVFTPAQQREVLVGGGDFAPTSELFRAVWDEAAGPDSLDRVSAIDLEHYFVDDLMTKNDRMMMAHSIEARFPYADRALFDVVRRVPASLRMRGLRRRSLQKRAVGALLPREIAGRSNMGLELPHSRWFLGPLRPMVERYLARERVEATGLLRHAPLAAMWDEHQRRRVDHGRPLWAAINVVAWHERFARG